MKASVQYDDYIGTCAADISDHKKLLDILREWGVDTGRYYPVGVTFYSGDYGPCSISILCNDTASDKKKIVIFRYDREPGYSVQEIQSLFKRFHVILTTEDNQDLELSECQEINIE